MIINEIFGTDSVHAKTDYAGTHHLRLSPFCCYLSLIDCYRNKQNIIIIHELNTESLNENSTILKSDEN